MSDSGLRIVEVEPAPCQHMHAWNYDPDDAKRGFPLKELPNGQMKCMDCGEFFFPRLPQPATPKYTLKEIEVLAQEYCNDDATSAARLEDRLRLSLFVQWLARREREGRDDT